MDPAHILSIQRDLNDVKDNLQASLAELIARKDSELNNLREENSRLLAALQPSTESLRVQKNDIEVLKAALSQLVLDKNSEITELQVQNAKLREEALTVEKQLHTATNELRERDLLINDLQQWKESHLATVQSEQHDNRLYTKQYQEEILFLRNEYENIFAENVSLRERIRVDSGRIEQLENRLLYEGPAHELQQADVALDQLSSRVGLIAEHQKAARDAHERDIQRLQELLAREAAQASEVRVRLDQVQKHTASLEGQLKEAKEEAQKLKGELDERTRALSTASVDTAQMTRTAEILKKAAAERDEVITDLRASLTVVQKERERDAVVIDMARKEIDETQKRLQEAEANTTKLTEMKHKLDAAVARAESLQAQAEMREIRVAELTQRLEAAEKRVAQATAMEADYAQLQRTAQDLRTQLANAETDHRAKVAQFEVQLKQLGDEYAMEKSRRKLEAEASARLQQLSERMRTQLNSLLNTKF